MSALTALETAPYARVIPFSAPHELGVSVADFTKAACLADMPIFSDLKPEEIKRLDARIVKKHVRKGQVIYRPGETGEVLFLLKKGSVHRTFFPRRAASSSSRLSAR